MRKTILFIFALVCLFVGIVFLLFNFVIYPKKYSNFVMFYSSEYNLDKSLVYAVIKAESGFDSDAVSRSGAMGLMQLLPSTGKWIAGELKEDFIENNLFIAEVNIKYGCFYLRYLLDKYKDLSIAICAYNAGEGIVKSWIDDDGKLDEQKIDYVETKNYLKKVKSYMNIYSSGIIFV